MLEINILLYDITAETCRLSDFHRNIVLDIDVKDSTESNNRNLNVEDRGGACNWMI